MYAMWVIHVICAAAVFLTCSQQHVVDVLAVASLGTKTKYINFVMYIIMQITLRVVMTELN